MAQKFKERLLEGTGYSSKKFECDYGLKILKMMGWKDGNGSSFLISLKDDKTFVQLKCLDKEYEVYHSEKEII